MKNALALILVAGVLLPLTSCNRSATTHLHLFAVSEYVPQEVIDGFTRETGIVVDYETFGTNEAMLQKFAPDPAQYDVIQPSDYMVERLIRKNLLAPLDRSKLSNFQNILPEYRNLPFDPDNQYSVPYMSGTVGIVVNTDKVKDPIRGYKDLFQEKYKERIVLLDDPREMVTWAMELHGIPINDVTPANLAVVKPTLLDWARLKNLYMKDDPKPPLIHGDRDLGVVYSGDAARLWQDDKKFQYVLPAEGVHRFVDNLCIPAASNNKEAALAFLNYLMKPEVSKILSDKFPYTNPNGAARKLLSKAQMDNPASYPALDAKAAIFRDIGKQADPIADMVGEIRHASE